VLLVPLNSFILVKNFCQKNCFSKEISKDEFQKFLFADTAPAKEQADFIKQQNLILIANNPDFQSPVTRFFLFKINFFRMFLLIL